MSRGYSIRFSSTPRLSSKPVMFPLTRNVEKARAWIWRWSRCYRSTLSPVYQTIQARVFYSLVFLVKKQNGNWRPIIDLSKLNKYISAGKFRMETTEAVREALQVGDWVASVDLTDAYFHIPIRVSSRKYLRFTHRGAVYQYRVLPFGICTAPLIFTLVMREVKDHAAEKSTSMSTCTSYDWLYSGQEPYGRW